MFKHSLNKTDQVKCINHAMFIYSDIPDLGKVILNFKKKCADVSYSEFQQSSFSWKM
jgi:hypothetical protein